MAKEFSEQIQFLARSGLATHVITNPTSVDSVFAVAKAQDLPDVSFAASFSDGSLVVGCPQALPDILDGLAEPIVVAPAPPPAVDTDALMDRINALNESIVAQQMPQPPDYTDQFAALNAAIDQINSQPSAPDLDQLVASVQAAAPASNQIETQIAALAEAVANLSPVQSQDLMLLDRFDQVDNALTALDPTKQLTRIEKMISAVHAHADANQGADHTGLQDALMRIEHQIQASMDGDKVTLDDIGDKLATLLAVDAAVDDLRRQIDIGFDTLKPAEDTAEEVPLQPEERLGTALDDIATRFEALADKLNTPPQPEDVVFRSESNKRPRPDPETNLVSMTDLRTLFGDMLENHLSQKMNGVLQR